MTSRVGWVRRWLAGVTACGTVGWGGVAIGQDPLPIPGVPDPFSPASAVEPAAPLPVPAVPDPFAAPLIPVQASDPPARLPDLQPDTTSPPASAPSASPAPATPAPAPAAPASSAAAPAPAVEKPMPAICLLCNEPKCPSVFDKVPPVRPFPRLGFFPMPPTGPGYYSLANGLQGQCLKAPPKYPYPRASLMPFSFFDADFRYLDDPKNTETDSFDPLKRIRLGDCWLFSTGGELRNRYMYESNSRLTRTDNDYLLTRARVYGDLWYRDQFRLFVEFLGAYSNGQELPPLPPDVNRADFLNLFVDVKTLQLGEAPVYLRVGRQELLLGSQRLVSPLEWANSRRTFQGVRAMRTTEKFDADLFWLRPVVPNPGELDSWDDEQDFFGAWATYKPRKGESFDGYYLGLVNRNTVTQQGIARAPFDVHTFGLRWTGAEPEGFLWDVEAALQFGDRGPSEIFAAMTALGLGYHCKDAPLTPTFWAYYDYASGDGNPNVGDFNTFNQLFAFGHYYMGWADQVARQNIHDLNFHLYLYPTKWATVWLQYHKFWLDARRDALYNAAGTAIRRDPTGAAGRDVGHEVDVVVNFHLTKHADLLTGYSHLFGGDFLRRTAGPGRSVDSGLYYLQLSYRW